MFLRNLSPFFIRNGFAFAIIPLFGVARAFSFAYLFDYCLQLKVYTFAKKPSLLWRLMNFKCNYMSACLVFLTHWYFSQTLTLNKLLSIPTLIFLFLLLRCDPSDINISDEMSKTTVWKSLNSNQKDTRPVAAKKARPHPLFPKPCHLEKFLPHFVVTLLFCVLKSTVFRGLPFSPAAHSKWRLMLGCSF